MSVNDQEKTGKTEVSPNKMDLGEDVTQVVATEGADAEKKYPEPEIDPSYQMYLQIANVFVFVLCMVLSATAQKFMPASLNEMSLQWDIKNTPARYAFGIWGVIYTLLAIFTVYQALPNKWVPNRNNQLIFGTIKHWYFFNMLLNSVWLILFMLNGTLGFTLSGIDIIAMLVSQFYIMRKCCEVKVNIIEFVAIRIGFTLYTGWVTAATILGVTYWLMSIGMKNPNAGFDESTWSVIILWVALVIYIAASVYERNPLYAGVYIWVVFAIKAKQLAYSDIQSNCIIIATITILSVLTIAGWNLYSLKNGTLKKGLFYNIEGKMM